MFDCLFSKCVTSGVCQGHIGHPQASRWPGRIKFTVPGVGRAKFQQGDESWYVGSTDSGGTPNRRRGESFVGAETVVVRSAEGVQHICYQCGHAWHRESDMGFMCPNCNSTRTGVMHKFANPGNKPVYRL